MSKRNRRKDRRAAPHDLGRLPEFLSEEQRERIEALRAQARRIEARREERDRLRDALRAANQLILALRGVESALIPTEPPEPWSSPDDPEPAEDPGPRTATRDAVHREQMMRWALSIRANVMKSIAELNVHDGGLPLPGEECETHVFYRLLRDSRVCEVDGELVPKLIGRVLDEADPNVSVRAHEKRWQRFVESRARFEEEYAHQAIDADNALMNASLKLASTILRDHAENPDDISPEQARQDIALLEQMKPALTRSEKQRADDLRRQAHNRMLLAVDPAV